MNPLDLQGRCAIVTGGASGIGLAAARRTIAWPCTEDCSFTTRAVFDLAGGRATC